MKKALNVVAVVLFLAQASGALAHAGSHKKVEGKITKVDAQMLHVAAKGGKETMVVLTPQTRFMVGKSAGTASDAHEGMRVIVHLTPDGSKAEEVHLPAAKAPQK